LRNKKMAAKTNHAKKTRIRVTTPAMSILIQSPRTDMQNSLETL
jgi:hypothetical protein